jgi:hypothetical protein
MKNTALRVCAKAAVFVTLAAGVMFFLFSYTHFWVRGILQKMYVRVCADRL